MINDFQKQNDIKFDIIKLRQALKLKMPLLALFPHTKKKNKDNKGSEALNENNLV